MTDERPPAPRISVVIAVRNAATVIGRAIDSVVAQDYPRVELIVIDGASTDGTHEIIEERADRIAFTLSEPDRGVYDAWNKALDRVTGDWTCFLGADDRFAASDVLTRAATRLALLPEATRVAYATVHVVDRAGDVTAVIGEPWEQSRLPFRERMTVPNPATFYHHTLFEVHGGFDESYRIVGDYEFLMRELLHHDAAFIPDLVAVLMDPGGLSDDPRSRLLRLREIATARHRHGLTRLPPWASPMVLRARLRAGVERVLGLERAGRLRSRYRAMTGQAPER
jgi:glycosyltransferase involved in cell wall biosynthesis